MSKYDKRPVRFSYDVSGNLEYVGLNTIDGIADDIPTWQVLKFIYSDGDISYIEGPIMGTWDGRASLNWT